ncbi:putative ABC transporter permease [Candidatus Uhrbacteria bacterium]|jgi:uncharacterized membrane protein|nr:MAG: putative ABC transporter permease [Candidatus Uhrbacteria bacterium]
MYWITVFFFYSFFGWCLDSGYRSWFARRWVMGNALKPIPLSPIYGVGVIFILLLEPAFAAWPILFQWIGYGAVLATIEGLSGPVVTRVCGRPLWKYSRDNSFLGYTDLWHAAIWGLLALLVIWFVHPSIFSAVG